MINSGMAMMLKSLGLDPSKIQEAVNAISTGLQFAVQSQNAINEKLDAIAKHLDIDLSNIQSAEQRMKALEGKGEGNGSGN